MSNQGERLDNNQKENNFKGKIISKTAIIKLLKYDNNSSTSLKPKNQNIQINQKMIPY